MTSPSTKSASGSEPQARRWRLRRTLSRATDYRPIEDADLKYLWAAYRQGAFEFENRDMNAAEFKSAFEQAVLSNCHAVWVLYGNTKRGFWPVGVVFAGWAPAGKFMMVSGAMWLPWATKRNIVECMVGFLNRVRKDFPLQFYALPEHKRLYEVCAMHGVVRRVGTSYAAIPGKSMAVFETSEKKAA